MEPWVNQALLLVARISPTDKIAERFLFLGGELDVESPNNPLNRLITDENVVAVYYAIRDNLVKEAYWAERFYRPLMARVMKLLTDKIEMAIGPLAGASQAVRTEARTRSFMRRRCEIAIIRGIDPVGIVNAFAAIDGAPVPYFPVFPKKPTKATVAAALKQLTDYFEVDRRFNPLAVLGLQGDKSLITVRNHFLATMQSVHEGTMNSGGLLYLSFLPLAVAFYSRAQVSQIDALPMKALWMMNFAQGMVVRDMVTRERPVPAPAVDQDPPPPPPKDVFSELYKTTFYLLVWVLIESMWPIERMLGMNHSVPIITLYVAPFGIGYIAPEGFGHILGFVQYFLGQEYPFIDPRYWKTFIDLAILLYAGSNFSAEQYGAITAMVAYAAYLLVSSNTTERLIAAASNISITSTIIIPPPPPPVAGVIAGGAAPVVVQQQARHKRLIWEILREYMTADENAPMLMVGGVQTVGGVIGPGIRKIILLAMVMYCTRSYQIFAERPSQCAIPIDIIRAINVEVLNFNEVEDSVSDPQYFKLLRAWGIVENAQTWQNGAQLTALQMYDEMSTSPYCTRVLAEVASLPNWEALFGMLAKGPEAGKPSDVYTLISIINTTYMPGYKTTAIRQLNEILTTLRAAHAMFLDYRSNNPLRLSGWNEDWRRRFNKAYPYEKQRRHRFWIVVFLGVFKLSAWTIGVSRDLIIMNAKHLGKAPDVMQRATGFKRRIKGITDLESFRMATANDDAKIKEVFRLMAQNAELIPVPINSVYKIYCHYLPGGLFGFDNDTLLIKDFGYYYPGANLGEIFRNVTNQLDSSGSGDDGWVTYRFFKSFIKTYGIYDLVASSVLGRFLVSQGKDPEQVAWTVAGKEISMEIIKTGILANLASIGIVALTMLTAFVDRMRGGPLWTLLWSRLKLIGTLLQFGIVKPNTTLRQYEVINQAANRGELLETNLGDVEDAFYHNVLRVLALSDVYGYFVLNGNEFTINVLLSYFPPGVLLSAWLSHVVYYADLYYKHQREASEIKSLPVEIVRGGAGAAAGVRVEPAAVENPGQGIMQLLGIPAIEESNTSLP